MRRILLRTALLFCAGLAASAAGAASGHHVHPADRAEARSFAMHGNLPGCDDPAVLGELSNRFNAREATYWGPLQALSYDRLSQIGYRSWGADFIPRRFCSARMLLNDGSLRRVDYSVREALGLFGLTWNVNWCVRGLDRQRSYAPDCKMARP